MAGGEEQGVPRGRPTVGREGGALWFATLDQEADHVRRDLDAEAVSAVDTPRPGIEVTITDPMIFATLPLRVCIAADPESGLTFTRMDAEGSWHTTFPSPSGRRPWTRGNSHPASAQEPSTTGRV